MFLYLKHIKFAIRLILTCCLFCTGMVNGVRAQHSIGSTGTEKSRLSQVKTDTAGMAQLFRRSAYMAPDSAIALLEPLVFTVKAQHLLQSFVQTSNHLAAAYSRKGQFQKALDVCNNAITESRKSTDSLLYLSDIHCNIASLYLFEGNFEKGIYYYYEAAKYAERNKHQSPASLARLYMNLGAALVQIRETQKAQPYFDKAEYFAAKAKDSAELGFAVLNRGTSFADSETPKAMQYFHRALGIAQRNKLSELSYATIMSLVGCYNRMGKPDSAILYLLEANGNAEKGQYDNPYYNWKILYELGSAHFKTGNYPLAERYLSKAQDMANEYGLYTNIMSSRYLLSYALFHLGKYKDAYLYMASAYVMRDSQMTADRIRVSNELEVKYRTAEKDKELVQKALEISRQGNALQRKNVWIGGITAGAAMLIMLSVGLYRNYRNRQRLQTNQIRLLQQEQDMNRLRAMVEGEERERQRLARDLHDGIGGMLAAINMNVSAVQQRYHTLFGLPELDPIMKMLEDTTEEVRKTAHNLMPDILIRNSFTEAIRLYCEQVNSGRNLHINLVFVNHIDLQHKSVELVLYRIVQELIQNIVKHAQATEAIIEIVQEQQLFNIVVEDNGIGFDPKDSHKGFGLQNLQYRVQSLQGTISIESARGMGTTINISFDLSILKSILYHEHQNSHSG